MIILILKHFPSDRRHLGGHQVINSQITKTLKEQTRWFFL